MSIFTVIHTIVSRILLFFIVILYLPPTILLMLMPAQWRFNSRFAFWFVNLFYNTILWCSLLPIKFKGKENIPKEPVIFAANHQSSLDIPIVGSLTGGDPHIWLATADLMTWWSMRWVLPYLAILIDITTPRAAMRSLLQALMVARKTKAHVMIFPEGGRFTDDEVHEFFGGFVILAKKTGRPVVPVRIFNANKVYPPDTFWARWHSITVVIGKPFVFQEGEDDAAFKERVYEWFVTQSE